MADNAESALEGNCRHPGLGGHREAKTLPARARWELLPWQTDPARAGAMGKCSCDQRRRQEKQGDPVLLLATRARDLQGGEAGTRPPARLSRAGNSS